MHMRFFAVPVLALSLLMGACQDPFSGSSPKVAVVDLNRLITDSNPGKAAKTFLDNMNKQFNDELGKKQAAAQANPKDEKAAQDLQATYMSLQQRMQTEAQNVNNALLEHVLSAVRKYREQNGLSAVLRSEAALDYDKALDVTDKVLDEVNKQNIEFKPVTHDDLAKPAPAAGSGEKAPAAPAAEPAAK